MSVAAALLALATAAAAGDASPPLPQHHRHWLEVEAAYLIADDEREAFLALRDDIARERFIGAFWAARDPLPSTPANEFRDEHLKRLRQAERRFGRASPTPGWRTERGRTWILLGPPRSRHFVPPSPSAYPMELWLYAGARALDLPTVFRLLFVQEHGVGEYRLYDPSIDGPAALVGFFGPSSGSGFGGPGNRGDAIRALRILERVDPEVAAAALSLYPTDPSASPMRSSRLLGKIRDLPERLPVDRSYLAGFGADVAVESAFPDVSVELDLGVASGRWCDALELRVVVPPAAVTLERTDGRLTGALEVTARIERADDRAVVGEIERRVPLVMTTGETAARARPLVMTLRRAVAPGPHRVRLLVRDVVSGRFGVAEASSAGSAPPPLAAERTVVELGETPSADLACASSLLRVAEEEAAACALELSSSREAALLRADIHLERGEVAMALASLDAAPWPAVDDGRWLLILARALAIVGDQEGAEQALDAAVAAPRVAPTVLNEVAHDLRTRRDQERAVRALERSLELDPLQPSVRALRDRLAR